jgi:putative spermidine/putrescine transport system substrate-binding protein
MKRWLGITGIAAAGIFLAGAAFYLSATRHAPVLTLASWAGPYGHAQASALLRPFAERSGVDVRIADYDGGTSDIARQVAAKTYNWDVIDLELPDAVDACRAGLLEPIDTESLPPGADGRPAKHDFVPGALGPCWVGSVIYSQAIAYNPHRFMGEQPKTLADFFDLKKFPGPRALHKTAKFNLEMALLADGVPPGEVYAVLSTQEGVHRALAKLGTLKGSLVWWSPDDPPAAMLADGRAAMATILNGDVFDAQNNGQTLATIWDGQLYEFDVFGIPKGDPKRALAMDFLRFATSAPALAGVASWVPYGPARRSAWPLVGINPELKLAMTPYEPTAPGRFGTAFAIDDGWWKLHGDDVDMLWRNWLNGGG